MRNQESSYKARERRLRAKYRRSMRIAIVIALIVGIAIGAVVGRVTAPKAEISDFSDPFVTSEPTSTPLLDGDDLSLSLEVTPAATEAPVVTAEPTEAPTPVPTATPVPTLVVVPFGSTQTLSAQIHNDGTVRKTVDDQTFETLNFDLRVTRYMTPEYYKENYSTQYQMQGNEAGVEFELILKDYMGTQVIIPQNLFVISLETDAGVSEQGFQLTDAEIHGDNKVTINTNIPKMFYKRFKFSESVGDMAYLSVTTVVDGIEQKYLFEVGAPLRPTPAPTPEVVYESMVVGSRGDNVMTLQAKLIELGYLTGTADGAYGAMTEQAVRAAQAAFGLEETGVADNALQHKLYN